MELKKDTGVVLFLYRMQPVLGSHTSIILAVCLGRAPVQQSSLMPSCVSCSPALEYTNGHMQSKSYFSLWQADERRSIPFLFTVWILPDEFYLRTSGLQSTRFFDFSLCTSGPMLGEEMSGHTSIRYEFSSLVAALMFITLIMKSILNWRIILQVES